MTGEEQRSIAFGYLNGTDGLTKNEQKGWECMKQAAELGDAQACFECAAHIVNSDCNGALRYIDKGDLAKNVKEEYIATYFKALAYRARLDPSTAKDGYGMAFAYVENLKKHNGNEWYFLAELAHLAGTDGEKVKEYLLRATIGDNRMADCGVFAAYGMEKGVLVGVEMLEKYLLSIPEDRAKKTYFAAVKKQEGLARALVEAALDEKAGRSLAKKYVEKIKSSRPQGILEYQKVFGANEYLSSYSYSFSHTTEDVGTTHTGSGTMEIESWYTTYGATFKCGIKNNDLNGWLNDMDLADALPDARVRVTVEREEDVRVGAYYRQVTARDVIKERVARKYGWSVSDTFLRSVEELAAPEKNMEDEIIYVPFWFFHYDVDGETLTARVNAATGEVDFFINNKFGQLGANDDARNGGNLQTAAEAVSSASGGGRVKFNWLIFIVLLFLIPGFGGFFYIVYWAIANAKNNK